MIIKEITPEQLDEFVFSHPLKNYYQTSSYATIMKKYGYEVFFIGGFFNNTLVATSVILSKFIIPTIKYGYAPRGFILDYYDDELLKDFTSAIKNYFFKKKFAFIKINPEITYALINTKNNTKIFNDTNIALIEKLKHLGYKKLKEEVNFNSALPKINAIINIDNYNFNDLKETFNESINIAKDYDLIFQIVSKDMIPNLYEIFNNKKQSITFYQDYYNYFNNKNMIDAIVISLDLAKYVLSLQVTYDKEMDDNNTINDEFTKNPSNQSLYNLKLNSDRNVENLKQNIIKMSTLLNNNKTKTIILACAYVIKMDNRLTITYYGDNKNYSNLLPKEYLMYKIIEEYKDDYKFFDFGEISKDYVNDKTIDNKLKLSLNPSVYEYIGEFDLEVNKLLLQVLLNSNKMKNEFKKQD